ncbi:MAG: hypothetical protein AAFW81_09410 [Pseudomonadota bacterium]
MTAFANACRLLAALVFVAQLGFASAQPHHAAHSEDTAHLVCGTIGDASPEAVGAVQALLDLETENAPKDDAGALHCVFCVVSIACAPEPDAAQVALGSVPATRLQPVRSAEAQTYAAGSPLGARAPPISA